MWFVKNKTKENKFKLLMFIWAIVIFALWIAWFILDLHFVSKGITIEHVSILDWSIKWDATWHNIVAIFGGTIIGFFGAFFFFEVVYLAFKVKQLKLNKSQAIYEIILHSIIAISILIPMCLAANRIVNEKWVLDFKLMIMGIDALYHMDFMNMMVVPFVMIVLSFVCIINSNRKKFEVKLLMRDANILFIVFASMLLLLLPPYLYNATPVKGAIIGEADVEHLFDHLCGAIITILTGVIAGASLVIGLFRIISFGFIKKGELRKSHIVIYSIIIFINFVTFVISHATALDFNKLLNNESFIPCVTCLAMTVASNIALAIYGSISLAKNHKTNKIQGQSKN